MVLQEREQFLLWKNLSLETNTLGLLSFIVQRHVRMKAHACITVEELIPVNQFSHLTNDRFAWIILSLCVILNVSYVKIWQATVPKRLFKIISSGSV